jgi:hypothetical protein
VLIVFVSLAVFFSPQWILWLAPLLLPLAPGRRGLIALIVALDLITFFTWPVRPELWHLHTDWVSAATGERLVDLAVYARFAVLAALAVVLLRPGWQEVKRSLG